MEQLSINCSNCYSNQLQPCRLDFAKIGGPTSFDCMKDLRLACRHVMTCRYQALPSFQASLFSWPAGKVESENLEPEEPERLVF